MLTPYAIARGQIMYPGQILEFVDGRLLLWNAQFVFKFPTGCDPYAELILFNLLFFKIIQRM